MKGIGKIEFVGKEKRKRETTLGKNIMIILILLSIIESCFAKWLFKITLALLAELT